jgi:hypothetical protein
VITEIAMVEILADKHLEDHTIGFRLFSRTLPIVPRPTIGLQYSKLKNKYSLYYFPMMGASAFMIKLDL